MCLSATSKRPRTGRAQIWAELGERERSRPDRELADHPPGQPPGNTTKTMAVASLATGGVLISQDISPAGPPGTGTWAPQTHDGFKGTFWSGQPGPDGPGSPGFTVKVQIRGRVQNDMISGTTRFSVFDPTGAPADSGTGTFSGHRVDAQSCFRERATAEDRPGRVSAGSRRHTGRLAGEADFGPDVGAFLPYVDDGERRRLRRGTASQ